MEKPKILTQEVIDAELISMSGWAFKDDKIYKEYEFGNFMQGIRFISDLAEYFEEANHHADVTIKHTKILFELQSVDIGGKVTDLDIEVAKEIERRFVAQ